MIFGWCQSTELIVGSTNRVMKNRLVIKIFSREFGKQAWTTNLALPSMIQSLFGWTVRSKPGRMIWNYFVRPVWKVRLPCFQFRCNTTSFLTDRSSPFKFLSNSICKKTNQLWKESHRWSRLRPVITMQLEHIMHMIVQAWNDSSSERWNVMRLSTFWRSASRACTDVFVRALDALPIVLSSYAFFVSITSNLTRRSLTHTFCRLLCLHSDSN